MEGTNYQVPPVPQPQDLPAAPPRGNVGFPGQAQQENSGSGKGGVLKWVGALIVVALIIVGGVFAIRNFTSEKSGDEASPTPDTLSSFATPKPTDTPTPSPSSTPKPKEEVKIEILNGTGTPGEASFLKTALEGLGFTEIEASNADNQDETKTTFSFNKDLSEVYVTEITKKLEELYSDVRVRRSTLEDFDVSIITGPRKGKEAGTSPSPSGSPSASSTPKASSTPTASPTASPAATP